MHWRKWFVLGMASMLGCGPAVGTSDDAQSDGSAGSTGGAESSDPAESSGMPTTSAGPTTAVPGTTDGPSGSTSGETGPVTTSRGTEGSESSGGESMTGDPPSQDICPGDREHEFSMTGTEQDAHDGRLVWAAAVEPDRVGTRGAAPVVVWLETVVQDGAFELTCEGGLTNNFDYPSFAVVIDADDDGECSGQDLAFVSQLFGWMAPQIYLFEGASAYSFELDPPWLVTDDAWQTVASTGPIGDQPLCDFYFPD